MDIHPVLLCPPFVLNEEQRTVVAHKQGPLLVVAGPGSGKTRSLLLLAMNLLLCEDAQPSELVLCTYTERAAYEMQDRLLQIATDAHYTGDLSKLRIGTIHGICKQIITEYIHYAPVQSDFKTLDEFEQRLFIYMHLSTLCHAPGCLPFFQWRWSSH